MTDPKNINPEEKSANENELIMKYIGDELNTIDKLETEQAIANSPFLSDAEEGLRLINDKNQIPYMTQSINREMRRKLKKRNREKRNIQPGIFIILIVALLLLLILTLSFMIIFRLKMTYIPQISGAFI
ncbi:MAG: hypothetical protein ACK50E_05720 [Bacteroidota bacterium]|jgi:hypothetical protein